MCFSFIIFFNSEFRVFTIDFNRDITTANGCSLIFVYMTYTMLPVRLREALIGGLVLSTVHIYLEVNSATRINYIEVHTAYICIVYRINVTDVEYRNTIEESGIFD